MSKSQKEQKTTIPEDEDLTIKPMSRRRRIFLIGVAIFCLVIFSVTGPMLSAFDKMVGGGPAVIATAEGPDGKIELTYADTQQAAALIRWEERILRFPRGRDEEDLLVYALMMRLADQSGYVVSDSTLKSWITNMLGGGPYQDLLNAYNFLTAAQFEATLRDVLRVYLFENMIMQSTVVPTADDVLDRFKETYEEFQAEYVVWRSSDFETAAAALEPTEEELQTFYDEGLSFTQRRDLENEEAVAFDVLYLTADAMETEKVQAWLDGEEPTEEALASFYDFNRRFLYERPLPEDGADPESELGPYFSREEVGDERLTRDWRLQRAAVALQSGATEAADLAAFADERGVELIQFEEPVPSSQLMDLEKVGNARLNALLRLEAGMFLASPLLGDGYAMIARANEQVARELPPLDEIRDSVVDYWREGRQPELAKEAAEAMIAAFPQPEIEGDAIVVEGELFSQSASDAGFDSSTLGWISRNRRAAVDPIWDAEDDVSDWLRSQIGRELDDAVEGQVLGAYENTFASDPFVVVARLVGTREPSTDQIWPAELARIRATIGNTMMMTFRADQLSFEAMAQNYSLERVVVDQ